jgi:hypothetical protein
LLPFPRHFGHVAIACDCRGIPHARANTGKAPEEALNENLCQQAT